MITEEVYHLNVFGSVYPEYGKKIFSNRKAIDNRLQKYKSMIIKKFSGLDMSPEERDELNDSIDNGYVITRIDPLVCTNWENLFLEENFKKNLPPDPGVECD